VDVNYSIVTISLNNNKTENYFCKNIKINPQLIRNKTFFNPKLISLKIAINWKLKNN